jgi:hypothetical protein
MKNVLTSNIRLYLFPLFIFPLFIGGCGVYSFTGASISPEVKSVSISFFPAYAPLAPANVPQVFTEALRDLFINRTNLDLLEKNGDISFEGYISGYQTRPVAIQGNEQAAQNRLTMTVNVTYTNTKDDSKSFEKSFSRFADFDAAQNLADVEQALIAEINDQLILDIYTWLNDPKSMNSESIPQLREVIKRYPYFAAAQMMLAKNLRSENHIDQLKQLQLSAVMAPNRKVLHDYLHDKKKPQPKSVDELEEADVESTIAKEKAQPVVEYQPIETEKQEQAEEVVQPRFPDELIPEPVIYQLETADLPELPATEEEVAEPEEVLSFSDWLSFTETGKLEQQEIVPKHSKESETGKRSTIDLIDHFLTQTDEVPKKKAEFFNPRKVAAKGDQGDFTVVSETLANIYFQQEKYELAKQAYESLSLKYPEKSVYFAARLKEIEEKLTL